MAISKDDVRREHEAALASLDAHQLQALRRISQAFLKSRFANAAAKDMMDQVFEEEAKARREAQAG